MCHFLITFFCFVSCFIPSLSAIKGWTDQDGYDTCDMCYNPTPSLPILMEQSTMDHQFQPQSIQPTLLPIFPTICTLACTLAAVGVRLAGIVT